MAKFDITKFAEALPDRADLPDSGMTREIPLGDILDNPHNFYPRPDNNALGALMESVQANGLLEPPTVVPDADGKSPATAAWRRCGCSRRIKTRPSQNSSPPCSAGCCPR